MAQIGSVVAQREETGWSHTAAWDKEQIMESSELRPRRRRWILALLGALALVVLIGVPIAIISIVPLTSESARVRLVAALSERLDGVVELHELHLQAFPKLRAEGVGLTVRHRGRRDVPPLVSIAHFSAEGSMLALARGHVARVTLTGLDIEIPPDRNRDPNDDAQADKGVQVGPDEPSADDDPTANTENTDWRRKYMRAVVIDELHSADAHLVIIPKEADKPPKVWSIHELRMTSVSADRPMPFEATLTNAVPPGAIATHGTFGPWEKGDPGLTPLDGMFEFEHADL